MTEFESNIINSPDAEKAVISLMMNTPSTIEYIDIPADAFCVPANRSIYQTLQSMFGAQEAIDLITVSERFMAAGRIESIGGAGYLAEVFSWSPTVAHLDKLSGDPAEILSVPGTDQVGYPGPPARGG